MTAVKHNYGEKVLIQVGHKTCGEPFSIKNLLLSLIVYFYMFCLNSNFMHAVWGFCEP